MPTKTISRCGSAATGFEAALLLSNPDALWKLDEVTGVVAHDSLSGAHDAGVWGGVLTWAYDTAPMGGPCAGAPGAKGMITSWLPAMTGDFTAAIWVRRFAEGESGLLNQGSAVGAGNGWGLNLRGLAVTGRLVGDVGDGAADHQIDADNLIVYGTWYWEVLSRISGTFHLYVNGVQQAASYAGAFTAATDKRIGIGYAPTAPGAEPTVSLAWASVWTTRGLPASEIAGIYSAL